MNKKGSLVVFSFAILIIIVIILIAVLFFAFKPKGLPKVQTMPADEVFFEADAFFKVLDKVSGKSLKSDFRVFYDSGEFVIGSVESGETERLRNLSSKYVYSVVAQSEGYYSELLRFNYSIGKFDLRLGRAVVPQVKVSRLKDDEFLLMIVPDGWVGGLDFCERHSGGGIIKVSAFDVDGKRLEEFVVPDFLVREADRCFVVGDLVKGTPIILNFTDVGLNDSKLSLLFMDKDLDLSGVLQRKFGDGDAGFADFWVDLI